MMLSRLFLMFCCLSTLWSAESPRGSGDTHAADTRTRAADARAAAMAAGMVLPTDLGAARALVRPAATIPAEAAVDKEDAEPETYPQQLSSEPKVDLEALALQWTDRSVHLPRLGQPLTEGRLAPRPIGAEYRLKPGDRLRLVTWGGTAENEVVLVDPSGSLAIPGFGAVPVSGLTVADAQLALTELVRSHFKQAGVLIGVEKAGAIAATVVGEVSTPGYQSLPPGATVLDALASAGGVTP